MRFSRTLIGVAVSVLLTVMVSCNPPPPPGDGGGNGGGSNSDDNSGIPDAPGTGTVGNGVVAENIFAPGVVMIPPGVSFRAQDLRVRTNIDNAPVSANGQFTVKTVSAETTLVQVVDQDDAIVLISWHDWILLRDPPEINTNTTAAALLYMAVGGWGLPPEATRDLRFEIENTEACQRLADVIAFALTKNRIALNCDPDVTESLEMETVNFINELSDDVFGNVSPKRTEKTRVDTGSDALISVSPRGEQGGITIVPNDDTATITARNQFGRAGLLYILETGYEDIEGNRIDHNVYQPIGEPIAIPDARTLSSSFNASIVIASVNVTDFDRAIWENREVGPIDLRQHEGANRTTYELVFLGPSFNPIDESILSATRYANVRSEWEDKLEELRLENFVFKVLIPLGEQMGLGASISTVFDSVPEAGRTLAQLILPILEGAGVTLTSRDGYVEALQVVIDRFMNNQAFRFDMIAALTLAYDARTAQQISTEQMANGMQRLVRMESFLLAIYNSFDNRDVAQVVDHLARSNDAEFWDAEVAAVRLDPSPVDLTQTILSKDITVSVAGSPAEPVTYEWSTSGDNGFIVAALTDPGDGDGLTSFTTTERTARYRALTFVVGDIDTVTVRATDANGVYLGAATTQVRGFQLEENPCNKFPEDDYQRGDRIRIVGASTNIVGGDRINVTVSFNATHSLPGVTVYASAACSRCNVGCFCTQEELQQIEIDGEPAGGGSDHGWVLIQHKDGANGREVQAFCMASATKRFTLPAEQESGTFEADFSFPVSPDWFGCSSVDSCGCPFIDDFYVRLNSGGGIETDSRKQVWHGYFILARAGNGEQALRTLAFARDPSFDPETAFDCPDDE